MYIRVHKLLNRLWIGKVKPSASAADATHVDIETYRTELEAAQKRLQQVEAQAERLANQVEEQRKELGGCEWEIRQLQAKLEQAEEMWEHWQAVAIAAQNDQKRAQKIRLVAIHNTYHRFHDVPLNVTPGNIQAAVNAAWKAIRELGGGPGDLVQNEFGMWKVSVKLAVHET